LVLESNLTYPQLTYENLAFTQLLLSLPDLTEDNGNASTLFHQRHGSRTTCEIRLPHLRGTQITTNLNLSYATEPPEDNATTLAIKIKYEMCDLPF
jgi:hypothetical protein